MTDCSATNPAHMDEEEQKLEQLTQLVDDILSDKEEQEEEQETPLPSSDVINGRYRII